MSEVKEEKKCTKYPKYVYHAEKSPKGLIVKSEKAEKELGAGWVDTPAKFVAKKVLKK